MKEKFRKTSCLLTVFFIAAASCASLEKAAGALIAQAQKAEAECKAKGGAYVLGKGCVLPSPVGAGLALPTGAASGAPTTAEPQPDPSPPAILQPPAGAGLALPSPVEAGLKPAPTNSACKSFGHTDTAAFRKGMDTPAKQFRVEPDELGGRDLARGRITAAVSGFADLAAPDRDSFFLLIETLHPNGFRVVFSGDTWRSGREMMTRFTAQHFPRGAARFERMAEFEHTLESAKKYLYDCSWTRTEAICGVTAIPPVDGGDTGGGWSAETHTPIQYPLGPLDRALIFGDMAANYQSMGHAAMVERACVSVY